MEPILLNEVPLNYHGEGLLFYAATYTANGALAIFAETIQGEPYTVVTVNIEDCELEKGQIVMSHDLTQEFALLFVQHFCERFVRPVRTGYVEVPIVELKDEIVNKITNANIVKDRTTYLDRMEREGD